MTTLHAPHPQAAAWCDLPRSHAGAPRGCHGRGHGGLHAVKGPAGRHHPGQRPWEPWHARRVWGRWGATVNGGTHTHPLGCGAGAQAGRWPARAHNAPDAPAPLPSRLLCHRLTMPWLRGRGTAHSYGHGHGCCTQCVCACRRAWRTSISRRGSGGASPLPTLGEVRALRGGSPGPPVSARRSAFRTAQRVDGVILSRRVHP